MKIIFLGTVEFSKKILQRLIGLNKNVVSVLTKKRSDFNSDYTDLSGICKNNGIECRFIDDVNDKKILSYIRSKNADIILCVGWSRLIKKELLDIPGLGVIGYHPALLPENRGRHPLIWALALGLENTGSTFFFMDEGADSGDIISQRKIKISYADNARTLYDKVSDIALKQVEEFMPQLERRNYKRIPQDDSKATYWRKRTEKDGEVDWRMSSYSIYNLIRALARPYIGAHFLYKGKRIKIWKASEAKGSGNNIEPGKIIKVFSKNSFLIKTGENCIRVLECSLDEKIKEGAYL